MALKNVEGKKGRINSHRVAFSICLQTNWTIFVQNSYGKHEFVY